MLNPNWSVTKSEIKSFFERKFFIGSVSVARGKWFSAFWW